MPVISTFFGIVIRMFYREHGLPHFHARRLIREWSLAHRQELVANWNRARSEEPLERIAPLD
jgi:hypothetical protein